MKTHADVFDIVFDATSAYAHMQHNAFFSAAGKFAVDLTPAHLGAICERKVHTRLHNA